MLKRILIFVLGLTSLSLGIALITNAHLGTSSISSFAYVLSMGTGLTMGLFVFVTNAFFFCVQTAIDPTQVLLKAVKQLPICAYRFLCPGGKTNGRCQQSYRQYRG